MKRGIKSICYFVLVYLCTSCKKLIAIDPPANTITTTETFADSANASSAIAGLYSKMVTDASFMSLQVTVNCGESADELVPYSPDNFYSNTLLSQYPFVNINFWTPAYQYIYQANAILEGVQSSSGLSTSAKNLFLGEARFLRSLYYFYLVNLFGDVPFISTIDYKSNASAARVSKGQIYQQIISDLKEAQIFLPYDYSISNSDRIRANHWAATALLARVYLYQQQWDSAEVQATSVINNSNLFSLNPNLNSVFLNYVSGNNEAILQWLINSQSSTFNATPEGATFIPNEAPNNLPNYYINSSLLQAFESGDLRKKSWLDSIVYRGTSYFIPFKYKIGSQLAVPNAIPTEYVMVLRLAEQFLIRAEARAEENNITGAISDLNVIRERAGLTDLSPSLSQAQALAAVFQERRIELAAEWGHRWFDLKRAGLVDSVMNIATPLKEQGSVWQSHQQLYPIPFGEIQDDPNLKQNPGY